MTTTVTDKEQMKEQKEVYGAHRPYVNVWFKQADMDFAFQWILGSTGNGGCEIGEAFYAVSRMKDGDPVSWQEEWLQAAKRAEKRGDDSFMKGCRVSAREAYHRASNYYRAILVGMNPLKPEFMKYGLKCRECFKKAGKLFDPPIEYVEIPFEGVNLPGYFIRGGSKGQKCKTLIMIGGGETMVEDMYFYIAPEVVRRGYNFISFDIPGQGLLPYEGKYFRRDTEVPLGAVMDYVQTLPEVEPDHIAMYGISGGGYYVPRAASFDKRIKAIIMNSAVVDGSGVFRAMDFAKNPDGIKDWEPFKLITFGVTAWRYGLLRKQQEELGQIPSANSHTEQEPLDKTKSTNSAAQASLPVVDKNVDITITPDIIAKLADVNEGHIYDPSQITCPALSITGEGEYANPEISGQQKAFMKGISSKTKTLIITPTNEGAASHCTGSNRSLMAGLVFDWLKGVWG